MRTVLSLACLLAIVCCCYGDIGYGYGYTVPVLRTVPLKTYGLGYGLSGYGLRGYGWGGQGHDHGYGKALGLGYGLGYGVRGYGLGYGLGYAKRWGGWTKY